MMNTIANFWNSRLAHKWQIYATNGIVVILTIQGLRALYNSIIFIFTEMPHLEQQLTSGLISQQQVNALANKAIIMIISTILSLFFALKINAIQSKTAERISAALAILLAIGNTQIANLLNQIGSTKLLTTVVLDSMKSIISF